MVEVTTVQLSNESVLLLVLDHTRQHAYAKKCAERLKLDRLLEDVAKQAVAFEQSKVEYDNAVAAMDAMSRRNQF